MLCPERSLRGISQSQLPLIQLPDPRGRGPGATSYRWPCASLFAVAALPRVCGQSTLHLCGQSTLHGDGGHWRLNDFTWAHIHRSLPTTLSRRPARAGPPWHRHHRLHRRFPRPAAAAAVTPVAAIVPATILAATAGAAERCGVCEGLWPSRPPCKKKMGL